VADAVPWRSVIGWVTALLMGRRRRWFSEPGYFEKGNLVYHGRMSRMVPCPLLYLANDAEVAAFVRGTMPPDFIGP
jgi:hypothetical protein